MKDIISVEFNNIFEEAWGNNGINFDKSEVLAKLKNKNKGGIVIYIGDTEKDKQAANINQIPFVYCTYGFAKTDGCREDIIASTSQKLQTQIAESIALEFTSLSNDGSSSF